MRIDAVTLADLEVFADKAGRGGLFALVDQTTTDAGRRDLRRRLASPLHDPDAIRAVQASVAFFASSERLPAPPSSGSTEHVERYLDSTIDARRRGPVARLVLAVRDRDLAAELAEGVRTTETWLYETESMAKGLLALGPPPLVRRIAERLTSALDDVPIRTRAGRGLRETLRMDRAYRVTVRDRLTTAIEALGEIDALRSMARATAAHGWVLPEIVDDDAFVLDGEGLTHPFLEDGTPNPIDVSGGHPVVFLTGPNMAGKTTYLRTAALVVLLAQVGMGVPATSVRLTPVEVLLTGLNPSDDLRAGLSFFQAEVLRVRDAAAALAAGERAFVLFDEVFKGTNVRDALEASATVILGFAKARGSGFVFSSHLAELVDTLGSEPRVRFRYFDGQISDGRAEYSYRVKDGVSDQRFGLFLLDRARIPELIERIGAWEGSGA